MSQENSVNSIHKYGLSKQTLGFVFVSDLRNMEAICSVSRGNLSHQTGSTALHGNPWIPLDSPELNKEMQQRSKVSNPKITTGLIQIQKNIFTMSSLRKKHTFVLCLRF